MRVLLDESVPRRLSSLIAGHDVTTVVGHEWAGMRNGELLERASPFVPQLLDALDNLPASPIVLAASTS